MDVLQINLALLETLVDVEDGHDQSLFYKQFEEGFQNVTNLHLLNRLAPRFGNRSVSSRPA